MRPETKFFLPEQAGPEISRQFSLHARHRHDDRQPLVNRQQPVDAHADQKQRERLLRMRLRRPLDDRHAAIMAHAPAAVTVFARTILV